MAEPPALGVAPLRHRSAMRVIAPFHHADHPLEAETPLFAADPDFARAHGGPLTRRFVDRLPAHPGPVVIDSSLVWLSPGLAHGFEAGGRGMGPRAPLRFAHEPFPGAVDGARGAANRDRAIVHRLCVVGHECTPEIAVGEIACPDAAAAEAFWFPAEDVAARDAAIDRLLAAGTLVRMPIPTGTIVELGWGALRRARPAASTGFQLILRASLGDRRPHVNGRRNLSMV